MKKNIIIVLLLSIVIPTIAFLVINRKAFKEVRRKQSRTYEFVDVKVGCKCGQQPSLEIPYHTNNFWPFEFTCAKCNTKYAIYRYPDYDYTRQPNDYEVTE